MKHWACISDRWAAPPYRRIPFKGSLVFAWLTVIALLALNGQGWSQDAGRFHLTADAVESQKRIRLTKNWLYRSGDNRAWAAPDLDDSDWIIRDTVLESDSLAKSDWPRIGWFRLHLSVDSSLTNQSLGIWIWQDGESQVYLNGRQIYRSRNAELRVFSLDDSTEHLLAVRYENADLLGQWRPGSAVGFYLFLGDPNTMIQRSLRTQRLESSVQMFFTAFPLAIGLLHLFLYFFMRRARGNLFYALLLFSAAAATFFDYQVVLAENMNESFFNLRIHRAITIFVWLFGARFLYELFYPKVPGVYWLLATGLVLTGALAVYDPIRLSTYYWMFSVVVIAEMTRIVVSAVRRKLDGAWIIAIGSALLYLFIGYDLLLDLELMQPFRDIENAYFFGLMGLIVSTSVYLARDFAKTNERIIEQERQAKEQEVRRRLLEADNERKTRELEEARALQLSMLPQSLPDHPGFEIAARMQTAKEVGGDYYDFHVADDGTLTVAIGDATGHGARAGVMVTSIKTLFSSLNRKTEIVPFFHRCTEVIRGMQIGNLYMALSLAQFNGTRMHASSAGMPPFLIHRAKTDAVEELVCKGQPLGGFEGYPYEVKEATLNAGDTVLLMTDGFEELFNKRNETLDFARVKDCFSGTAGHSLEQILQHLFATAAAWRKDAPQNDDITFVLVRVKHVRTA